MDFKGKIEYDKNPTRPFGRSAIMYSTAPEDESYYNTQYMYGNENFGQNITTNQNNPMLATMGMTSNTMGMGTDDQNVNYYQEYCRLFIANVVLTTQMKELVAEKNELLAKLAKLEQKQTETTSKSPSVGDTNNNSDTKKKRERRRACQIDRHYTCPFEKCQKSYGSEGSLNQHIKNKHPDLANNPEFKITASMKKS